MKPTRRGNYSVAARPYSSEFSGNPSLWRGAFWLKLNDAVSIAFVPALPVAPEALRSPADLDEPVNRDEALARITLGSSYVITPNDALAGHTTRLEPTIENNEADTTIFFVTSDEFLAAVEDLERIHQATHGYVPSSHYREEFSDTVVLRLVEDRVFPSPHLGRFERSILPVRD